MVSASQLPEGVIRANLVGIASERVRAQRVVITHAVNETTIPMPVVECSPAITAVVGAALMAAAVVDRIQRLLLPPRPCQLGVDRFEAIAVCL